MRLYYEIVLSLSLMMLMDCEVTPAFLATLGQFDTACFTSSRIVGALLILNRVARSVRLVVEGARPSPIIVVLCSPAGSNLTSFGVFNDMDSILSIISFLWHIWIVYYLFGVEPSWVLLVPIAISSPLGYDWSDRNIFKSSLVP